PRQFKNLWTTFRNVRKIAADRGQVVDPYNLAVLLLIRSRWPGVLNKPDELFRIWETNKTANLSKRDRALAQVGVSEEPELLPLLDSARFTDPAEVYRLSELLNALA